MTEPTKNRVSGSRRKAEKSALSHADMFRASPFEQSEMSRAGLSHAAARIIADLALARTSGLKRSVTTVHRKAAKNETLSPSDSERLIGVTRLLGQLKVMVEESGDADGFEAGAWMSRWLTEPLPALGGTRPIDLLDTMEGQSLVSTALAQMQSAAYG
jgi:uncharacterized protein (DUF2384 family)